MGTFRSTTILFFMKNHPYGSSQLGFFHRAPSHHPGEWKTFFHEINHPFHGNIHEYSIQWSPLNPTPISSYVYLVSNTPWLWKPLRFFVPPKFLESNVAATHSDTEATPREVDKSMIPWLDKERSCRWNRTWKTTYEIMFLFAMVVLRWSQPPVQKMLVYNPH